VSKGQSWGCGAGCSLLFWTFVISFIVWSCAGCAAPPPAPTPQVIIKTLPAPSPQVVTLPPVKIEVTPIECAQALDAAEAIIANNTEWLQAMSASDFDKAEALTKKVESLYANYSTLAALCRGTATAGPSAMSAQTG